MRVWLIYILSKLQFVTRFQLIVDDAEKHCYLYLYNVNGVTMIKNNVTINIIGIERKKKNERSYVAV